MSWDRASLPWLPPPPADFTARCRALGAGPSAAGEARALSSYRLNANHLTSLSRAIRKRVAAGEALAPLTPLTLALIGDGSHELIADALVATAPRFGLRLSIVELPFNSGELMALDPGSALHRARPDVVLFNFTYRAFDKPVSFGDAGEAQSVVDEGLDRIRSIADRVQQSWQPLILVQTIPPPATTTFGSLDRMLPGTASSMLDALNDGLLEVARGSRVLFDAAALARSVGLDAWHDDTQWYGYKLPFAQRLVPLYADHVARTLAAARGLTRKCLVLDLDNTLWGGVIGDDGMDGIRLGQGSPEGEAFLAVQRMALQLRRRGVLLAVSSKNTDAVARQVFTEHPEMVLKESDITVFQANWDDKPRNLEAIAKALDIGVDSLVLLDDNPAERELVRQKLPAVAVPELPEDPALYPLTLLGSGLFEAVSFSQEDSRRTEMYGARAEIAARREGAADLGAFLDSLGMSISFAPFDAVSRSRIAQLINKSNQFNLTTRRYTETEVEAMENDSRLLTLQVRLQDKFADHGMIGVVICRPATPATWEIDTWLMSCRVLGRRVEEAVLTEIVEQAAARGVSELRGRYVASERNAMVAAHYGTLGFRLVEESATESTWTLTVSDFPRRTLPFEVFHPARA